MFQLNEISFSYFLRYSIKNKEGLSKFAEKAGSARTTTAMQQWLYASFLSGPKTQLRNFVPTGLMIPLRMTETAIAARVGRVMKTEDPVMTGEAAAMWAGIKMGWRDAFAVAGKAWRTGQTPFTKAGGTEKFGFVPRENAISAERAGWSRWSPHGMAANAHRRPKPIVKNGLDDRKIFFCLRDLAYEDIFPNDGFSRQNPVCRTGIHHKFIFKIHRVAG